MEMCRENYVRQKSRAAIVLKSRYECEYWKFDTADRQIGTIGSATD